MPIEGGIIVVNRSLWSALAGAFAVLVLLAGNPAIAADGDTMTVGEKNSAVRVTRLNTRGGLRIDNFKPGNPALILNTVEATPPMQVSSTGLVSNLNADLLDGLEATGFALSGHDQHVSPVVIGLAAFHGVGNLTEWTFSLDYVQTGNDDASGSVFGRVVAPVDLPDGAHITGLLARLQDGSATARVDVRLLRVKREKTYPEYLDDISCRSVLMASSDLASAPGLTTISDNVVTAACSEVGYESDPDYPFYTESDWSLVDNSIWTYYLQVELERTGGLDQHARFYSAAVSFTGP